MPRSTLHSLVGLAAVGALAAVPLSAQEHPYLQPDDSWLTIDGTIERVLPDEFVLAYGDGEIVVEMDDGDRDADAYPLNAGDRVTVTGKIDEDTIERRTIEASSVFVESIDTWFFASPADEEGAWGPMTTPLEGANGVVTGTIVEIGDDEFRLSSGLAEITVDTGELATDPLDDEGYPRLDVGDRVSVTGTIDDGLFEGRELLAARVTNLYTGATAITTY